MTLLAGKGKQQTIISSRDRKHGLYLMNLLARKRKQQNHIFFKGQKTNLSGLILPGLKLILPGLKLILPGLKFILLWPFEK